MEDFTTSRSRAVAGPSGTRRRRTFVGSAAVIAAAVLTLVATGAGAAAQSRHSAPRTHAPVVIDSAKHGSLGTILVTKSRYTLYYDKSDTTSKIRAPADAPPSGRRCCSPAASTPRTAGPGVTQSSLGVVHRPAGGRQVTYAGHPLYRYVQDASPGQAKGEGVGGFYVVKTNMKKVLGPDHDDDAGRRRHDLDDPAVERLRSDPTRAQMVRPRRNVGWQCRCAARDQDQPSDEALLAGMAHGEEWPRSPSSAVTSAGSTAWRPPCSVTRARPRTSPRRPSRGRGATPRSSTPGGGSRRGCSP